MPKPKKVIACQDWFFSDLNRRLIKEFYKKNNIPQNEDVLRKFEIYDRHLKVNLADPNESISHREVYERKADVATSANLNRGELQDSINPQDCIEVKQLVEPEIPYLLSMLKTPSDKWEQKSVLCELHAQASYTAKALTQEMIEGRTPICHLIDQHSVVDKNTVMNLLYRCEKLYQTRQDV